jgi:hypothetical protein
MVTSPTINRTTKAVLARIAKALVEFAKKQGWTKNQFEVLFHVMEDWWRIRVMLVVDDFGDRSEREMWDQVHEYLKDSLDRDGGIEPFSLGLSVREKSQVERGGIYTIPDTYVEAADLLPASSLDDY